VTRSENASEQGVSPVSPNAVRAQMERVLSTDGFSRSPRMSGFVRFVVSETLAGNAGRLKEYAIAVEVFGRDDSFDPNTNAVVRVEASRLRRRLQEYFLDPGRDDPVHIALPSGSYVPTFKIESARQDGVPGSRAPLALPDRPSIVVLPFTNIGDDVEQGYFADGSIGSINGVLNVSPAQFPANNAPAHARTVRLKFRSLRRYRLVLPSSSPPHCHLGRASSALCRRGERGSP
jgi:hypothetical protein